MTERSSGPHRSSLERTALYAGGFLGPFGGGIVASILPEIGDDLGVSTSAAASSLTAYLLPFALLMLVSGTLGARWGQMRTVRIAYGVHLISSLACFLAPTLPLFLGARVLQGCSNSFTTPLLLAALASTTPRKHLGRALGIFGAFQAAGQSSAPLVGGLAAEVDWRLAFLVIALVAAVLGLIGTPNSPPTEAGPPRLRDALTPSVLRIGMVALLGWGALGGLSFLVAFRAEDVFALSPTERGLLLTSFGVAGILTARLIGDIVDRIGARSAVLLGTTCGAVLIAATGTVPLLAVAAVAWFIAGAAGQFVLVGVNAAALSSPGPNRTGAVSVVQALRFTGYALAPITLAPLYVISPAASFLAPALLLAVLAPILMPRDSTSA